MMTSLRERWRWSQKAGRQSEVIHLLEMARSRAAWPPLAYLAAAEGLKHGRKAKDLKPRSLMLVSSVDEVAP